MSKTLRKSLLGAAVCAASVIGMGAGSALAGEITGEGSLTPIKARQGELPNSDCAFSGLEDNQDGGPGVTQTPANHGDPGVPGFACNKGHRP